MFVGKVLPIASMSLALAILVGCATEQSRNEPKQNVEVPGEHSSPDIAAVTSAREEPDAWSVAKSSKDADVLSIYLNRFPQGAHQAMAKLRLKLIESGELH